MTFIPVPNGIKVELNGQQNGIPVVNRFYVDNGGPVSETALNDVILLTKTFFGDIRGGFHTSYALQDITATDVSVANGIQVISPMVTANTGTASGAAGAANAAAVASFRTGRTGRSYRGRMYFGALPQSAFTSAQTLDTSFVAGFSDALASFITVLETAGKALVVASFVADKVARAIAVITDVTAVIIDSKVDSQRRRTAN